MRTLGDTAHMAAAASSHDHDPSNQPTDRHPAEQQHGTRAKEEEGGVRCRGKIRDNAQARRWDFWRSRLVRCCGRCIADEHMGILEFAAERGMPAGSRWYGTDRYREATGLVGKKERVQLIRHDRTHRSRKFHHLFWRLDRPTDRMKCVRILAQRSGTVRAVVRDAGEVEATYVFPYASSVVLCFPFWFWFLAPLHSSVKTLNDAFGKQRRREHAACGCSALEIEAELVLRPFGPGRSAIDFALSFSRFTMTLAVAADV